MHSDDPYCLCVAEGLTPETQGASSVLISDGPGLVAILLPPAASPVHQRGYTEAER